MQKYLRIMIYPFQWAPLVLVMLFSFLFLVSMQAGLFGMPLASLLSIWYFKYCFRVADSSANGEASAPILEYEDIFPFYELRPLKLVVIIALYASLFYFVGGNKLAIAGTIILLPAVIWSLITEDSFVSAINPLRLLVYMYQVGLAYLPPVLFLGLASYVMSVTIDSHAGIFITLMVFLYVVLFLFHLLGMVLYQNRDYLGYEGRSRKEKWEQWDQWQEDKERARKLNHWYMLTKASKYQDALEEIAGFITKNGDRIEDYTSLLGELWSWEKVRLAEMVSGLYVKRLYQDGQKQKILHLYRENIAEGRFIRLEGEDLVYAIAAYAREHRFFDVMLAVLKDFDQKYPESPEIANVSRARAEVMCFELHDCSAAWLYLEEMLNRFSWLEHDMEFVALYNKLRSLRNLQ